MTPGGASEAIRLAVREAVREVNQKTMAKAFRVSNAMRNSAIEVLTNPSPSSPGNPPGVRTGFLRRAWKTGVRMNGGNSNSSISITAYADSKASCAGYLEDGTHNKDGTVRMAARPFVDPILDDVEPEVDSIFSDF